MALIGYFIVFFVFVSYIIIIIAPFVTEIRTAWFLLIAFGAALLIFNKIGTGEYIFNSGKTRWALGGNILIFGSIAIGLAMIAIEDGKHRDEVFLDRCVGKEVRAGESASRAIRKCNLELKDSKMTNELRSEERQERRRGP
jgi:hypothetical protein